MKKQLMLDSMQSNHIIQSLWIGTELSPMEVLCIRSYLFHGHDFHLYVYDDTIRNIPLGTTLMNANEIIPQSDIHIDLFGGFVNFSNQFRYTLLLKKGGWWVDMDTVCLKPFNFEDDFVFSSETSEPHNRMLVNTTYIKSLPNSKFLSDCLDFIKIRGYNDIHWGELGVNLISRMIFRNNLERFIKLPVAFCPVSIYKLSYLISNTNYQISSSTYAIHWWHEMWKVYEIDKYGTLANESIFEKLKIKYL
jgi:Mannosyltransferase OCH1 and related enzymes